MKPKFRLFSMENSVLIWQKEVVNFISTMSINIPFQHALMHRKQALHSMRQSGIFLSLVFTAADINYLNGKTSFLATVITLKFEQDGFTLDCLIPEKDAEIIENSIDLDQSSLLGVV